MLKFYIIILLVIFTLSNITQAVMHSQLGGGGAYVQLELNGRDSLYSKHPLLSILKSQNESVNSVLDFFNYAELQFDPQLLNLDFLDSNGFEKGKAEDVGWSYHSVNFRQGGAAFRFMYKDEKGWENKWAMYNDRPAHTVDIRDLSPIEKYEMLIGAQDHRLTLKEWEFGKSYIDQNLPIPGWAGSCHGTAPASSYEKEPLNNITTYSRNGTEIVFTPYDLKFLLSYAWANNNPPYRMLGNRCNYSLNSEFFNIVSSCKDVDPAELHVALINFLNVNNKPLIVDTSPGLEVWNRPVTKYNYEYMNPITRRTTTSLKVALTPIDKYRQNNSCSGCSSDVKYVIGIWNKLTILSDTPLDSDDLSEKRYTEVELLYHLFLDENKNMLSGKWVNNFHPDFAWTSSPQFKPANFDDQFYISRYNHQPQSSVDRVPAELFETADKSYEDNLVSYYLINFLNEQSRLN